MKTALKVMAFVLIVFLLGAAASFGSFCYKNVRWTEIDVDGAMTSAAKVDWPSMSVVRYWHTGNYEFIRIQKFGPMADLIYYFDSGRLHFVTVRGLKVTQDFSDPAVLTVHAQVAKAVLAKMQKEFPQIAQPAVLR